MSGVLRTSVRECIRIADMYGYKMELITLWFDKYYLLLKDNFLKSPYPNSIYSRYFGVKTLDRLREKEII